MSICKVVSCVVRRGCLLWSVSSLGKTLLVFALLHFVLQSQTCLLLQVTLDFLLLHSNPLWWKGHLFWCSRRSCTRASLVAQMVKNLPAKWETQVSLGWENLLKKGMATHSTILASRIPWTGARWATVIGSQRVERDWVTNTSIFLEGLVDLHRSTYFNFFNISGWGIDLDYCDVGWFALETNWDHSVVFEIVPKYCISDSLVDFRGTVFLLRDSCPHSSRYNGHLN